MKNRKMLNAYANSEREAVVESDNAHAMIAVLFDELLRSMNTYSKNLDKKSADLELRGKSFSKAISIIYALQSSLNFEEGGELSANLFRLYEYARLNLLDSFSSQNPSGINGAIESLTEISQAWHSVQKQVGVEVAQR